MSKKELGGVFALGGLLYGLIEILYRGSTHWPMVLTGGACMSMIHCMNKLLCRCRFLTRCMCSCLLITVTEFVVGVIVNIKCRMDVWNYSRNRFQYKGQVCLLYSFFWFLLSIPALWISSGINRHKIKKTSLEAGISFKKEEYRN